MPIFQQIPTNNSPALGDFIIGVSAGGVDQKTPLDKVLSILNLDWRDASASTWTFSSYSSSTHIGVITVPSDATLTYRRGQWIRFTQATGGVKWGMITAVTSTSLTVNLFGYTLNNEAITAQAFSPLPVPLGAPVLPYVWTEGNGWTVWDYGVERRIFRSGTFAAATVGAGSFAFRNTGINYPVSTSVDSIEGTKVAFNDQAIAGNLDSASTGSVQFVIQNAYSGGGVNPNIKWFCELRIQV